MQHPGKAMLLKQRTHRRFIASIGEHPLEIGRRARSGQIFQTPGPQIVDSDHAPPLPSNHSTEWLPMKPAAPVTKKTLASCAALQIRDRNWKMDACRAGAAYNNDFMEARTTLTTPTPTVFDWHFLAPRYWPIWLGLGLMKDHGRAAVSLATGIGGQTGRWLSKSPAAAAASPRSIWRCVSQN
jgi:hypothetical protein